MKGHFLRINKGFFKDTMRLYLVSAIVFSVISALSSYIMGYSMCSRDAAAMNFHIDTDLIQVLVCIFMTYLGASLARKLTDMNVAEVYASIPVSRDSIWTAHLLTGIIYSLMIMAASTIGMLLGELTGAISVGQSIGSYGYSALEYLAGLCMIMLEGLLDFAFIGVAFSITGKVFAGIVTAGIGSFGIGILFSSLIGTGTNMYSVGNIIFPFSAAARTAAVWVVFIVIVLLLLLLFRKMFLTIRTESYSHAFRNKRIQTIVGLILAFSILCTIAYTIADVEASGEIMNYRDDIVSAVIATIVTCLIVYFIFMWISGRSFKKAAVSLKYLPISLLAVCIVVPLNIGVRKAYKNVDFSADNIAYYTIPNYTLVTEEPDWYGNSIEFSLSPTFYTDYSQDRYGKGVSGEDEVRFTDQKMINGISKYLKSGRNSVDSVGFHGQPSIYVTLKNGKTYAVDIAWDAIDKDIRYDINARQNEEYRNAMYDIERFKGGHFVLENKRANALYDTFIEELSALTIEEREKLFNLSSIYYLDPAMAEITAPEIIGDGVDTVGDGADGDVLKEQNSTPYARVLLIANGSNSLIRGVILNESTPKTLEAYLKLSNELNAKDERIDKALKFLESENMNVDLQFELMIWDKEKQESYRYFVEADTNKGWEFEYYEPDDYELEMMDEFLTESFHVSVYELTDEERLAVYYTMDFTSGLNFYEQMGMDEEGLTDEIRREDLNKLIGLGDEDHYPEEYNSAARDLLTGFLHGDTNFDSSRYVVTIVNMEITSLVEVDGFAYEYVETVMMNTASNFFDYPMTFGISDEDYNGFIHDFIEKYDNTVYSGEPLYSR